jgi:hypothetical protein
MATTKQLSHLSKEIANKARQLIPRSSNRVIFGDADRNDLAKDSQWSDAPEYLQVQIMAQRSRKSQNNLRSSLISSIPTL